MGKLDDLDGLVGRNPHGISIEDISRKLNVSRSWVYDSLRTLQTRGRAYYLHGYAYPGTTKSVNENRQIPVNNTPSEENQASYAFQALVGYNEPVYFKRLPEQPERACRRMKDSKSL